MQAAKWKDKYYIYRFKPINVADAEYELKMLNNPLSQLTAVASSIEISLDVATASQQFRIYGKDSVIILLHAHIVLISQ